MNLSLNSIDGTAIYVGPWINWSKGRLFGATITMNKSSGNIFIAFMALFIGITGTSLWRIVAFISFNIVSKSTPQDGVYHQRQAVFRNSFREVEVIFKLIKIYMSWRAHAKNLGRRLIPCVVLALVVFLLVNAAGAFSSQIAVTPRTEVLLSGRNCGYVRTRGITGSDQTLIWRPYHSEFQNKASNYALRCYDPKENTSGCQTYVRKSLHSTITHNASCPFEESICKSKDKNILIDTGILDSHYDLGINAPLEDRFQYREKIHCAPLATQGHTKTKNQMIRFYYGPYAPFGVRIHEYSYQYVLNRSRIDDFIGFFPADYSIV